MVPSLPQKNSLLNSNLLKRTLSTAIGAPLAVAAVTLGSPYIDITAFLLLGILLWEWSKMSGLPLSHPVNGIVVLIMGWLIFGTHTFLPAFAMVSVGFAYILYYHYQAGAKLFPTFILLSGPLYIGLGMTSILNLAKYNPLILLWALAIVWSTDVGAYVVGSLLGGPKLVPKISPGKTWSGFVGGSVIGAFLGQAIAPTCHILISDQVLLLCLSLVTTFVAHTGDILESAVKRLFKVKDSSQIIPGHGGLLDRLDSLLLVSIFFVILLYFRILP
jgi:phosphatidate cytidylyltransferase